MYIIIMVHSVRSSAMYVGYLLSFYRLTTFVSFDMEVLEDPLVIDSPGGTGIALEHV